MTKLLETTFYGKIGGDRSFFQIYFSTVNKGVEAVDQVSKLLLLRSFFYRIIALSL